MAFQPLNAIKAHPYIAAGGVFVVGLILVLVLAGGGEPTNANQVVGTVGADPSTVAANSALVQGQLAAGVANQQTAAGLTANLAAIAGQDKANQLAAQNDASQIQSQTTVALATLSAQKDTQSLVSTLSAQVSQAQIAAQQASSANANATNVQIASLNAQSQKDQANFMADVQMANIKSQQDRDMIAANRDITMNAQNANLQQGLALTYVSGQRDVLNANIAQASINADLNKYVVGSQADAYKYSIGKQAEIQSQYITAQSEADIRASYVENERNARDAYVERERLIVGQNVDFQRMANEAAAANLNYQSQQSRDALDRARIDAATQANQQASHDAMEQMMSVTHRAELDFLIQNAQLTVMANSR